MKREPSVKVDGRRYSLRKTTSFASMKEWEKWRAAIIAQGGKIGLEFPERLTMVLTACRGILERKGLPTVPVVFYGRDRKAWQATPLDTSPCNSILLSAYVEDICGCDRDSPEDLAARIITTADWMGNPAGARPIEERARAMGYAFKLGEEWTLLNVYMLDSGEQRKRAKTAAAEKTRRKNERKDELANAAKPILRENPRLSKVRLAELLAERGYGGAEAIRKLL